MKSFIKSLKINHWIALSGILLSFIALFCLFAPAAKTTHYGEEILFFPAYSFVFMGIVHRKFNSYGTISFSDGQLYRAAFTSLAAWILMVLSLIGSIIWLICSVKKRKNNFVVPIILFIALLTASILLFASKRSVYLALIEDDPGDLRNKDIEEGIKSFHLQLKFGFIGTGIFTLSSSICFGAAASIQLLQEKNNR